MSRLDKFQARIEKAERALAQKLASADPKHFSRKDLAKWARCDLQQARRVCSALLDAKKIKPTKQLQSTNRGHGGRPASVFVFVG